MKVLFALIYISLGDDVRDVCVALIILNRYKNVSSILSLALNHLAPNDDTLDEASVQLLQSKANLICAGRDFNYF